MRLFAYLTGSNERLTGPILDPLPLFGSAQGGNTALERLVDCGLSCQDAKSNIISDGNPLAGSQKRREGWRRKQTCISDSTASSQFSTAPSADTDSEKLTTSPSGPMIPSACFLTWNVRKSASLRPCYGRLLGPLGWWTRDDGWQRSTSSYGAVLRPHCVIDREFREGHR